MLSWISFNTLKMSSSTSVNTLWSVGRDGYLELLPVSRLETSNQRHPETKGCKGRDKKKRTEDIGGRGSPWGSPHSGHLWPLWMVMHGPYWSRNAIKAFSLSLHICIYNHLYPRTQIYTYLYNILYNRIILYSWESWSQSPFLRSVMVSEP